MCFPCFLTFFKTFHFVDGNGNKRDLMSTNLKDLSKRWASQIQLHTLQAPPLPSSALYCNGMQRDLSFWGTSSCVDLLLPGLVTLKMKYGFHFWDVLFSSDIYFIVSVPSGLSVLNVTRFPLHSCGATILWSTWTFWQTWQIWCIHIGVCMYSCRYAFILSVTWPKFYAIS